jgi:F-type H+-transporting ATPase subunit epsilon
MAGKTFKLEIITPRKVVYSGEVQSFTVPGVMGGFQVLVNHAPLLAQISIGEVKVEDAGGVEMRYATSGGFVEVSNNHAVLLAETAELPEEIDLNRAQAARDRAQKRIDEHSVGTDIDRARLALYRAVNRLLVAQHE